MKYIIIGLGNYGGVLAEELSVLGHEVIGVDNKRASCGCVEGQNRDFFYY